MWYYKKRDDDDDDDGVDDEEGDDECREKQNEKLFEFEYNVFFSLLLF